MTRPIDLSNWIGRRCKSCDIVTPAMVESFLCTLDRGGDVAAVARKDASAPQGIHWLCALPKVAMSQIGPDGHPGQGNLLPPTELPNRMWAASEIRFERPIRIGAGIERISTVANVTKKSGSTGALIFVDVDHVIQADGECAVRERQTIVYRTRGGPQAAKWQSAEPTGFDDWPLKRAVVPDSVLLFRYSALTFNGHRIHYDERYATEVEGYPALVVHGPLIATLLLDLCDREFGSNVLARFSFRGVSPAFCGEELRLLARRDLETVHLRAAAVDGRVVMSAEGSLRDSR